jgi:hypothetical protein
MADVHAWKHDKHGTVPAAIGEMGPMGRILIRGEEGHDIIEELYPIAGEPVVDKPGRRRHSLEMDGQGLLYSLLYYILFSLLFYQEKDLSMPQTWKPSCKPKKL